jgi:sugar phosphate isomerase/epimerase
MMQASIQRRDVLKYLSAGGLLAFTGQSWGAQPAAQIRIGACTVNLEEAQKAGLQGVEVRAGNAADTLEIADPAVQQKYKDQMQATGLPISSLMMGLLNSYPLASDPRGPAWLAQSIDGAKAVGAKVILVAFFGKGSLLDDNKQLKKADVDVVVERLKAAAPRAAKAGVTLAIENTLSAQQNLEILQRVGHPSVAVYYDVGNSTKQGYDVPAEIRLLGKRIVQFHFKDNPHYLGEGPIQFPDVAAAVRDIGYRGWIVLETTNPSKDKVADVRRNAAFVKKLFGLP